MRSESLKSQAVDFNYDLDVAHILRITSNVLALMLMRTSEYIAKYDMYTEELGKTIKEAMELQQEMDMVVNQIAENKY